MKFSGRVQTGSLTRVRRALEEGTQRAYPLLEREFTNWGIAWQKRMGARFTGVTGPESLRNRSFRLRESLHSKVSGSSLNDLRLRLTSDGVNYARLHEYGGEIKPVRAQYLTIPILANLSATGGVRYPTVASLMSSYPGRTTFFRAKDGDLMFGVKDAKVGKTEAFGTRPIQRKATKASKGKIAPFFVLKKGVKVPARLGFRKTWEELAPSRRIGLANVARQIGRG